MGNFSLKLELTADEVDVILTALGEQPFIKVHELINKVRVQAVPQWQAIQEAQKPKENFKE
jgi:hypothetical protein